VSPSSFFDASPVCFFEALFDRLRDARRGAELGASHHVGEFGIFVRRRCLRGSDHD
jgi:hypothetical protein